jgi:ribosomal-protein-alanine N-acetyltransferase
MAPRYAIRRFHPDDIDRIIEIERASFGQFAYDRKLFAELDRKSGGLFLLAEGGRKTFGYAITCIRGRRANLVSIAVDPKERGKGAASSLLESTVRRLKLRGVLRFTLMVRETNRGARRFYERRGFTKLRRIPEYYEDGEDGILMVRDCSNAPGRK